MDADEGATPAPDASNCSGPTVVSPGLIPTSPVQTSSEDFELGDTIGRGGMGVVRVARQLSLSRTVAIKTLREDRRDASHWAALMHEARATGLLQHPNIVPIYTVGESADGAPLIVMKRVEGISLGECLAAPERAPNYNPADPMAWQLQVMDQVCRASHFAHSQGILHRDIKPENVMLGSYGEVYLVDWGLAVTTDDAKSSFLLHARNASGVAGTPAYMAPEMAAGQGGQLSPRTDVYLLGATLFHAVTGSPPHHGATVSDAVAEALESAPVVAPGLPGELLEICRRAMEKDPSRRFESAEALRLALVDFSRHRTSIALTADAQLRLDELRRLVAVADAKDSVFRGVAGEVRFALQQALAIWPDNTTAQAARSAWVDAMIRWELRNGNIAAADSLLAELPQAPEPLRALVEGHRSAHATRAAEVARLAGLGHAADLGVGAQTRTGVGVATVVVWTVLPLIGGVTTGWGERPLSPVRYVAQSSLVIAFIAAMWLWKGWLQNLAGRRIFRLAAAYAAIVPVYRVAAVLSGLPTYRALAMENSLYALAFAGISIASDRSGLVPLVAYAVSALLGTLYPDFVYAFLASANLVAMSWLVRIWNSQRSG